MLTWWSYVNTWPIRMNVWENTTVSLHCALVLSVAAEPGQGGHGPIFQKYLFRSLAFCLRILPTKWSIHFVIKKSKILHHVLFSSLRQFGSPPGHYFEIASTTTGYNKLKKYVLNCYSLAVLLCLCVCHILLNTVTVTLDTIIRIRWFMLRSTKNYGTLLKCCPWS